MRRGLIKDAGEMLDFACAYAGEGHPESRDVQLPVFESIQKEVIDALKEHALLLKVAKAAVEMRAMCPADSDATKDYERACGAFDMAVSQYNRKTGGL